MKKINLGNDMKRYLYELENDGYCAFNVRKFGIIDIEIKGKQRAKASEIVKYLKEVTRLVKDTEGIAQINIKKSNHYLQHIAQKCGYKMIPARRFSFNIWVHR